MIGALFVLRKDDPDLDAEYPAASDSTQLDNHNQALQLDRKEHLKRALRATSMGSLGIVAKTFSSTGETSDVNNGQMAEEIERVTIICINRRCMTSAMMCLSEKHGKFLRRNNVSSAKQN